MYRVVVAFVIQEGKVLFKCSRPAAGPRAHFVLAALLPEHHLPHVLHGDVVVVPLRLAVARAVVQQHGLVALVAETQFAHCQLQLPQRAGLRPAGSFSPSGRVLPQALALPSLPVQQGFDHMLKLALREALEHRGNWQRQDKAAEALSTGDDEGITWFLGNFRQCEIPTKQIVLRL